MRMTTAPSLKIALIVCELSLRSILVAILSWFASGKWLASLPPASFRFPQARTPVTLAESGDFGGESDPDNLRFLSSIMLLRFGNHDLPEPLADANLPISMFPPAVDRLGDSVALSACRQRPGKLPAPSRFPATTRGSHRKSHPAPAC